jgi:hypothetical protein
MSTFSRRHILHGAAALLLPLTAASAPLPEPAVPEKDAPSLFPAPDSLEKISAEFRAADTRTATHTDPKSALLEAAAVLRAKADLFRSGKCPKAELQAAGAEVNRAAAAYRASLRSGSAKRK